MALTDTKIKQSKAKEKDYKLADEKGLFLLIKTTGAKYWRHKYRFLSKEKLLALGVYPEVSLKEARKRRDDARQLLEQHIDPSQHKQALKLSKAASHANTFEAIATEWLNQEKDNWSPAHTKKQSWLLEKNLFPYIGTSPISEINL